MSPNLQRVDVGILPTSMAQFGSISSRSNGLLFPLSLVFKNANLVLLMVGRVVNVLIPAQLGIVTDELTGDNGKPRIPSGELSEN
jgi:hypothetical protein